MNSTTAAIDLVRSEFPNADFYIFWQIASELTNKNIADGQLTKIIQSIQENQRSFHCQANTSTSQQYQFSTVFSLYKRAVEFFNQGFVLVCDDITIWEQLIKTTTSKQINVVLDWVCKVYRYTTQKTLINAIEMLNHPLLTQDKEFNKLITDWEYIIRKQQQSLDTDLPNHPLCSYLLKITYKNNFPDLFKEIIQRLPTAIQSQTNILLEYTHLLDGENHCAEWFKKAVYMNTCSAQIRLGLHEALKFTPTQVVFCLRHSQIRPQLSYLLFKDIKKENLTEQLLQWKGQNLLNILSHSQETIFSHPLVNSECLQKCQEKQFPMVGEKPSAIPIISSRPTTISATGFNLLMQDPYGFYARYILKLRTLERTANQNFAKEFGLAAHKAIEIYLKNELDAASKYVQALKLSSPSVLWKSRLLRILNWVHDQINDLHPKEIQSEKDFHTVLGSITIKARIDVLLSVTAGNLVVNFKTGMPPSKTEVTSGYAPQLAIEMFLGHKAYEHQPIQAEFWQLKGTQPAGISSSSLAIPMNTLQTELEKIISHYLMRNSPFLTCPWPSKTPKCNEYKNLERLT